MKPEKEKTKRSTIDEAFVWAVECFNEFIVVLFLGVWEALKKIFKFPPAYFVALAIMFFIYYVSIQNGEHLYLLNKIDPETFNRGILSKIYNLGFNTNLYTLFFASFIPLFIILGMNQRFKRTKYKRIFENIGVVNKNGESPVLISSKKLGKHREKLIFDTKGIGIKKFNDNQDSLESSFDKSIEIISNGKSPKYIEIILNENKIDKFISFKDISKSCRLPADSFYIGKSKSGILTQKIEELPHMLIAGSTGAGKSVYFKSVLMGLLNSSERTKLYLIDLKNGLEMMDFKNVPNVRIVKNIRDAVSLLDKMKKEMNRRFNYLEAKGLKKIVPDRDDMDRIIIGIDESSVLYMKPSKSDPDYELILRARQLTDSLAKLSRAACINLILATQKVSKETIDTTIQENISARMCFKMNTLQGSLVVLGNKDATELPEIKGRAIWSYGNKRTEVQCPFIDEKDIKFYSDQLKQNKKHSKRKSSKRTNDDVSNSKNSSDDLFDRI